MRPDSFEDEMCVGLTLPPADGPSKITTELLEETYERLRVSADQPEDDGAAADDLEPSQYLKIVNAFDMPAWRWDEVRGGFEKSAYDSVLRTVRIADAEKSTGPRRRRHSRQERWQSRSIFETASTSSSRSSFATSTSALRPSLIPSELIT